MTQEMVERYGADNMKAVADYKAKYMPNGTETKLPDTPKDIPVGTILTQYWLNSMTYYMVTRTTKKGVEMVEIVDKEIGFDHDGGGTGTRYCMPDLVRTAKLQTMYQDFVKRNGVDIFNLGKNESWPRDWFDGLSEADKNVYWDLHNSKGCSQKILKITKPAKNGGFWIPGVHSGNWCGAMHLWDGTPDSEYYGD